MVAKTTVLAASLFERGVEIVLLTRGKFGASVFTRSGFMRVCSSDIARGADRRHDGSGRRHAGQRHRIRSRRGHARDNEVGGRA